MLLRLCLIVLLAFVGVGQVAAIRRLVTRRDAGAQQLALLLVAGGILLLVASVVTRWSPGLSLPVWLAASVAVLASTAILCGIALFERARRTSTV